MKNIFLTKEDNDQVSKAIESFENTTGAELVITIAKESDPYPGAIYRGAIFLGFLISVIAHYLSPEEYKDFAVVLFFISIIFMTFVSKNELIKKIFLTNEEVDREVREKALDYFYRFCTTKTSHKTSTFLYLSLLEKKIELLVDEDLSQKITQNELDSIVKSLSEKFQKHEFKEGIISSIETIEEKVLKEFPEKLNQISPDEIKNEIHWV